METHFLKDLLIVFALGGLVVYALRAIKLPPIVGLLVAGAAMGPHGFSLVEDVHRVEVLAEVGVVLLLFTVGLEFSLGQLLKMWRMLVFGGGGQVLACIALVALCTSFQGAGLGKPIFFGFLAALSSTAIVLRSFAERAQLNSPLGRIVLGVLLFQDLCIVPLMLVTPLLSGQGGGAASLFTTLAEAIVVVVAVVLFARWLVPPLLLKVVQSRSRELFLTFLLVLCLGTAYLTSLAGLSLALGAFLAGLAVSESEYSHQALAEAIPFRDAFGSLFFVSIGMLMDVRFVFAEPLLVLGVLIALVLIKTATAALPALWLGYPVHLSLNAGLALAQVGEFAFVLSRAGLDLGLINATENQVFLSASVLSMLVTPFLIYAGRELGRRLPSDAIARRPASLDESEPFIASDHVVIAGYGVNGQNLARALSSAGISYAIVEMNPETVRAARGRGEPMHYGDCTRVAVLESLGIQRARMYVVAISDAASTRQTTSLARSLNPSLDILVRTRFVAEVEELRRLGANEVIPEEFETSIEIFARVLHRFDVPKNLILDAVARVRGGMYDMLRGANRTQRPLTSKISGLDALELERFELRPGSTVIGRTLSELELRQTTGATVLAVKRGAVLHSSPTGDFCLEASDTIVVLGEPSAIDKVLALVDPHVPVS
ncbi:MAG TPA: cation:proton antiporter [Polyangiaceae bacterium]|nr:cation:proton antiporter [Polyangiaceae bacterium]